MVALIQKDCIIFRKIEYYISLKTRRMPISLLTFITLQDEIRRGRVGAAVGKA